MKKLINFLLLAFSIMGIIGGIGYTLWCGAYPIAIGIAATGYLAYPNIVKCYKELTE